MLLLISSNKSTHKILQAFVSSCSVTEQRVAKKSGELAEKVWLKDPESRSGCGEMNGRRCLCLEGNLSGKRSRHGLDGDEKDKSKKMNNDRKLT